MKYNVFPKLCRDCNHSKPEHNFEWNNRCYHVKVVIRDSQALAGNYEGQPAGVCCRDERGKKWFAACGMKGKLWEPKVEDEEKCDCGCKR